MRKYLVTLWQNMDHIHSVRISISYFSLTRTNSPRVFDRLYVRVGSSVVSIVLPREGTLHHTLRNILIHLAGFPSICLVLVNSDLAADSQTISTFNSLSRLLEKRYKEISLISLLESTSIIMEKALSCLPPLRLSTPAFSPMHLTVLNVCQLYMVYALQHMEYTTDTEAVQTIQPQG